MTREVTRRIHCALIELVGNCVSQDVIGKIHLIATSCYYFVVCLFYFWCGITTLGNCPKYIIPHISDLSIGFDKNV